MASHQTTSLLTQRSDDHGVVGAVGAAARVGGGEGDGSVQADDVAEDGGVRHTDTDGVLGAHVVHSVSHAQPLQPLPLGNHAADTWQ